ncbi:MAG: hypothetical protein EPO62_01800 [Candidatus Nitrosotenuis sp.]|nr:MAG: hypothetical protein EPO62_01800 [Candidatus Nitrosotenuis sp.]
MTGLGTCLEDLANDRMFRGRSHTMKYRSRSEIITKVLEISMTGATKAGVMGKAHISYEQVDGYLDFLQEQNLICESGKRFYRITEKGIKFLSRSYELNELMFLPKSGPVSKA